jgi:hypothetical protein
MSTLDESRRDALNELRRAGYAANSHPTRFDCVVVSDPVYTTWGGGGTRTTHEYRTVPINRVWKFIDDRS